MKGTLHKTEQGWTVRYLDYKKAHDIMYCGESLPLHPDDESLWMFAELNEEWKDKLDGKEVEFEIVSRVLGASGISQTFAKLITSKEQQKQLITEIMELDAKDGLYEDVKPKIDIQPMTQEEMNEIRNPAYKYFNIDDTVNDTVNELDKLAEKTFKGDDATTFVQREIWKDGYKKAKETLYTEEQVRELVSLIRTELVKNQYNHYSINYEEIIQSLKQPKKN